MKKTLIAFVSMLMLTLPIMAQETASDRTPHYFVGVQGGIQKEHMNSYKNWQPVARINVGAMITPVLGVRLDANGIWNNGHRAWQNPHRYDYRYLTGNADLLVNLCNANNREKLFPVNAYWITGIGVMHAWDNAEDWPSNRMQWAANGRIGFAVDVPLCKYVSVNAEVDMNNYIHRTEDHTLTDNIMCTAQLGLTFKFGYKKTQHKVSEPETVPQVREEPVEPMVVSEPVEPKPQPVVEQKKAPEKIEREVFYTIATSDAQGAEQQKVDELATWMKNHPSATCTLTGYADAGTGTPAINQRYSQKRAETVKNALVKAGVSASRITTDAKGDTVQPFAENDKNRCVIAVAEEK